MTASTLMTLTTSSASALSLSRRVYAGAVRKASAAFSVLCELHACRIWVPRLEVMDRVANSIYYGGGYDACERYESVDEFKESLAEELDAAFAREVHNAVDCYLVRPFFVSNPEWLRHLGLGYFSGYARMLDFKELSGLDVPDAEESDSVAGLSSLELEWLLTAYRRKTVTLVNTLRKLSTSLHYLKTALANEEAATPHRKSFFSTCERDPGVAELVAKLETLCAMDFLPAPARHFGTEADRTNPLKALPEDEASLACLLAGPR